MCEAVLSVERGRMHVGLLTVGVPYMHRMEPPIPKHLAEAPAELLTALTALTVPGALVASLPDDAWLGVGLGSVKPLGFGLGLGLGLRLGLGQSRTKLVRGTKLASSSELVRPLLIYRSLALGVAYTFSTTTENSS